MKNIIVKDKNICIQSINDEDYISLNKEANKQKQIFNDNLNYNKALEHK